MKKHIKKITKNDLKEYIIKLNKNDSFTYSKYIDNLFINFDFKYDVEIEDIKKYSMKILENYNNLFSKIDYIFKKDSDFTCRFINEVYFSKRKTLQRFIKKPDLFENDLKGNLNYLRNSFFIGLRKFRYLYFIYYKDYTNYYVCTYAYSRETFNTFIKHLSDDDVINVYKIFHYSSKIIDNENMVEMIEKAVANLSKIPEIKIIKHEIKEENYKMVKSFIKNIDKYQSKFKEINIYNINDTIKYISPIMIQIISCDLKYNSYVFNMKFVESDSNLYVCIYDQDGVLIKDVIYRIEDFDRIFLFLNKNYDCE